MKPQMQWSYLFKHWFATLSVYPIFSVIYSVFDHYARFSGTLKIFIISFICSLPTLIVYSFGFYYLKESSISIKFAKANLITISIAGILITFLKIFEDSFPYPLVLLYIFTSLITGIIFRLGKKLTAKS